MAIDKPLCTGGYASALSAAKNLLEGGHQALPPCGIYDVSSVNPTPKQMFKFIVDGFVGSVLTMLGVIFNFLVIFRIICAPRQQRTVHRFIALLCFFDNTLLVFTWLALSLPTIAKKSFAKDPSSYVRFIPIAKTCMSATRSCVIWCTMLMTFERFLNVKYPHRTMTQRIKARLPLLHTGACVLCIGLAIPQYFEGMYIPCCNLGTGLLSEEFLPRSSVLPGTIYHTMYHLIVRMTLVNIGPFVVISALTIVTLKKMKAIAEQLESAWVSDATLREQIRKYNEVIVKLVAKFIILNTLPVVNDIVEVLVPNRRSFFQYMVDVGNFSVALHSATDGVFYLVYSRNALGNVFDMDYTGENFPLSGASSAIRSRTPSGVSNVGFAEGQLQPAAQRTGLLAVEDAKRQRSLSRESLGQRPDTPRL